MRLALILSLLFTFTITTANAQKKRAYKAAKNGWIVLGSKHVKKKLEKDVLHVGKNKGAFTKLKIKATEGTVFIKSMVVFYNNGTKEEVSLKHRFHRGEASRVIDLRGNARAIKKITFVYDRKNADKSAKIWVGGRR